MSKLLDWIFAALVGLMAKRLVAEAETHTAIRCADSLQRVYERADQLAADGYEQLARELRSFADGIDVQHPGKNALDGLEYLSGDTTAVESGPSITPQAALPSASQEQPKLPQKKRGRTKSSRSDTGT